MQQNEEIIDVTETQIKEEPLKEETPKEEKKSSAPPVLAVDPKSQLILARDNAELFGIIKLFMKGQAFPKTLDTPEKVVAAWQVAASLNLPPMTAIQNLAVIHGSVSMWGQLPKALAEKTGELEDYSLLLINKEQKVISLANSNLTDEVWGAVCQIKRKGRSKNEYVFTMEDAKKAKLDNKDGPWRQYTKIMLSRRAIAQAIKFEFPDALMGVEVAEYDHNVAPDLKDVTPSQSRDAIAEELMQRDQKNKEVNNG